MRYGSIFLHKLQKKYSLNYVLAINSEAHERKDCRYPTIYTGSAGKLMMCVHVKGKQAHLGEVLKGFNPLRLLSQIVTETDMNFDMADVDILILSRRLLGVI
jgi:arginine utilization protein RocB